MILFVLTFTPLSSQTWKYNTGGNPFDGEYKIAYVVGTSNDRLYDSPTLYVRKYDNESEIDVFLTNIGFSGYVSSISYVFNHEEVNHISSSCVSEGKGNESIFISDKREEYEYPYKNYCEFDLLEFINQLSQKSFVDIRLNKDGDSNYDCRFKLSGSQRAINWVLGANFISDILKREKAINEINAEVDSLENDYEHCYNQLEYTIEDKVRGIRESNCKNENCFNELDSVIISIREELTAVNKIVNKSNERISKIEYKIQSSQLSKLEISNRFYGLVNFFQKKQSEFPLYFNLLNELSDDNTTSRDSIKQLNERRRIEEEKRLENLLLSEFNDFEKSIIKLNKILNQDSIKTLGNPEDKTRTSNLINTMSDFSTFSGLLYLLSNDYSISNNLIYLKEAVSSIISNPNYYPFFGGNLWNHSFSKEISNSKRNFEPYKQSLIKLFDCLELNPAESEIILKKLKSSFESINIAKTSKRNQY